MENPMLLSDSSMPRRERLPPSDDTAFGRQSVAALFSEVSFAQSLMAFRSAAQLSPKQHLSSFSPKPRLSVHHESEAPRDSDETLDVSPAACLSQSPDTGAGACGDPKDRQRPSPQNLSAVQGGPPGATGGPNVQWSSKPADGAPRADIPAALESSPPSQLPSPFAPLNSMATTQFLGLIWQDFLRQRYRLEADSTDQRAELPCKEGEQEPPVKRLLVRRGLAVSMGITSGVGGEESEPAASGATPPSVLATCWANMTRGHKILAVCGCGVGGESLRQLYGSAHIDTARSIAEAAYPGQVSTGCNVVLRDQGRS